MLRLSRWVAVVAILLSASVAFAQRPAGGRPGGFGGGFGGFGGGGPLTIVNNEAVQKELGLKEEQVGKLKTLGEEVREEMRAGGGAGGGREAFQGLQDLPREEREKKMAEIFAKGAEARKKVEDKFKPKLAEILDASQRERLQQIAWQNARSQVYQDAGVIAALKITKEQQEKLAAVSKDFVEKQRELGQGGGGGGDEAQTKRRELSESRDKALSEVLTGDQREQFTKLMGKKFDLPQLGGGFGGGRPGQGGGGANPAGRPQRKTEGGDKKKDSN